MDFIHFTHPFYDYLRIIWKKLWLIGLIFALVVGITAFITLRQVPVYQATCKIRYKRDNPVSYITAGSIFQYMNSYYDAVSFETEKHVIKSKLIVGAVVKTLGLASPEQVPQWKSWVSRVQGMISISKLEDTRIYLITARSRNPDLTQAVANTAAAVYIDFSLKERQESAEKVLTVLTDQISELKVKIQKSEMAKIDYVEKTGAVPERRDSAESLTGPHLSAYQAANLINSLRSQLVKQEIEREQLLNKYKEKHPRVMEADRQIRFLKEKIAVENQRVIQAHKAAIEYGMLEKEAQADQDQYKILIKKLKDLNLSDIGMESGIEIIERAEHPTFPIAPRKQRNIILSALLGLALGLGAAMVMEYFDLTLQTPEEIESYLDIPVLASIPRMKPPSGLAGKESFRYLSRIREARPSGNEIEMFKSLRTNVRFSDLDVESMALLVTSSSPQEGKSTVTANLASTTAHAGSNTILIDADMRRPSMHTVFNVENMIGLSSFLKGEAELREIICSTDVDGLSLIPSGPVPPNPSELLESQRLPELISSLKERFDRIILDSPPAGALADASIIAALVDGVILVCYAGHIDRKFILRTKQQLEMAGAKLYGVVINYIELKLRSYYHYYHTFYKYGNR